VETTPSIAARWLFPRLGAFVKELGWIELSVNVDQRVSAAGDGAADICLRMGSGPWAGFDGHVLIEDALVPVASREYWTSLGKGKDLNDSVLLHDGDPNARWSLWREQFGPANLDVNEGPRYTSGDLVLRAAEHGLGVALGRLSFAKSSIDAGLLIAPFKKQLTSSDLRIWLLTPHSRTKTKAVRQTIDWLTAQARA
jgi:LysR family glycine cleavage system transcriptional activator